MSLNNNNILISFQGETTIIYSTMSRDIKPVKDRWHQLQLQTTKEQPTDTTEPMFSTEIFESVF